MNQGFRFNNSGTPTQAYVSPYYSCVWAPPGHRSPGIQRAHFTSPSCSNRRGKHTTTLAIPLSAPSPDGIGRFNPHNRHHRTAA
jgi:hypothetical protein